VRVIAIMATLTVQTIDRAGDGLTPAFSVASGGGDDFPNTGREFVVVKNGSGAPITVTAVTPQTVAGSLAIADETYAVPAAGERYIGPFPTGPFNNAQGRVSLTYSGVTSLTVGAFKVG
jgi:hypothetical protein